MWLIQLQTQVQFVILGALKTFSLEKVLLMLYDT